MAEAEAVSEVLTEVKPGATEEKTMFGIDIKSIHDKIRSGHIKVTSSLSLRNETAQTGSGGRIAKLRRGFDKKSRLVILTELAFDYNPLDPNETDTKETFSEEKKWRPLLTPTTVGLVLKKEAHEREEVKRALMQRANVKEWDTSDFTVINKKDEALLRPARVVRIFTVPVFDVRDPAFGDYSKSFMVEVKRDEMTGNIVGEIPIWMKIAKFWRDRHYEEEKHIMACIEAAKKGEKYTLKAKNAALNRFEATGLASITDKDLAPILQELREAIPVGSERSANFIIGYEIPLASDLSFDKAKLKSVISAQGMQKALFFAPLTKELRTQVIDRYLSGTSVKKDTNLDFIEVDMLCPEEGSCSDDPRQIGGATRYNAVTIPLSSAVRIETEDGEEIDKVQSAEIYDGFLSFLTANVNNAQKLENKFLQSTRIDRYDEAVEKQLLASFGEKIEILKDPFVTEKVLLTNKEIISLAFGPEGAAAITEVSIGLSDRAPGELDEAAAEASQRSIAAMLDAEDGEDSVETKETPAKDVSADPLTGFGATTIDME